MGSEHCGPGLIASFSSTSPLAVQYQFQGQKSSVGSNESRAMPLERHIDDLTACDGIKFWMSDGERPVLCRVSHEALRDLAERVHFEGTDEKVFEAYRELIEQVASDAYEAGTSFDDAGLVLVTSEALARVGRSA